MTDILQLPGWEGPLSLNPQTGYGQLRAINPSTGNREAVGAHRLSYLFYVGDIPSGLAVLHKCDNRKCVNPKHLFLGDHKENAIDMVKKGRNHVNSKSGKLHGMCKFKESDIIYIRESDKSGIEISKELGMSRTNISAIRNRKIWKHI